MALGRRLVQARKPIKRQNLASSLVAVFFVFCVLDLVVGNEAEARCETSVLKAERELRDFPERERIHARRDEPRPAARLFEVAFCLASAK